MTARVAVLWGLGLHCHSEALAAYRSVGAAASLVDASAFLAGQADLSAYDLLHVSGGFSFGDDGGAGVAFAQELRQGPAWSALVAWLAAGGRVVGVCNGMQILAASGLLPNIAGTYTREVELQPNLGGQFVDRWVRCVGRLPNLPDQYLEMPVRHAEGRVVPASPDIAQQIEDLQLAVLRYVDLGDDVTEQAPDNPSGSQGGVAGLLSADGRVLGLMPHPEAAMSPLQHPAWLVRRRLGDLPEHGDGERLLRWLVGPFLQRDTP
ncbi:MAG: phosphoribosylformylglycinamidine synthase subunit PurQ [Deltaproteobacteria bacterium]|nr:phosphoribosylformylglycinamidine synthase subunit PurQ [Deltaproteobacteria bacterium]